MKKYLFLLLSILSFCNYNLMANEKESIEHSNNISINIINPCIMPSIEQNFSNNNEIAIYKERRLNYINCMKQFIDILETNIQQEVNFLDGEKKKLNDYLSKENE